MMLNAINKNGKQHNVIKNNKLEKMKNILTIVFVWFFSFTSAFAGNDNQTRELARTTESDIGGGIDGNQYQYYFVSICRTTHLLKIDHKLNEEEKAYWQGYYNGLCPKDIYYL